ncbi:MAG: hypothetical protein II563_07925 [Treponema sp.]|nr:hypothetical protein [Treponema sp.]
MTRKEFEKVSLFVIFHFSIVGDIEKVLVHAVVQFYFVVATAAGYFLISGISPPII